MAATYSHNLSQPPNAQRPQRKPDMTRLAVRHDTGKLPAAMLAIIVHIAFFALIVFGVTWQVKNPMPLSAEIWSALPPIRNPLVVPPPEPEPVAPKPESAIAKAPSQPTRAEIELKAKRELADQKKRDEAKLADDRKKAVDDKKRRELATAKAQQLADAKLRAEQEAREVAANAARSAAISDYSTKIRELIFNRANIPDTVTGRPKIVVRLRLLVNGVVFDAKVLNPSGNPVYDEAFERAINGIQQWPLPENPAILGGQRELILKFVHER